MLWQQEAAACVLNKGCKMCMVEKLYSHHLLGLEKVPRCEVIKVHNPFYQ